MTKKVLIKGGLGLIGSKLVQKFRDVEEICYFLTSRVLRSLKLSRIIPESCGLIDFDVAVVRNY